MTTRPHLLQLITALAAAGSGFCASQDVAVAHAPAASAPQAQVPTPSAADVAAHPLLQAIAPFDQLDARATSFVRVIRVEQGYLDEYYGFLLKQEAQHCTIRTLDLRERSFTIDEHHALEETSVEAFVAYLKRFAISSDDLDERRFFHASPDAPMHPEAQAIVLARALLQRGEVAASAQLLSRSEHQLAHLRRAIAHHITLAVGDTHRPLNELVALHDQWLTSFAPSSLEEILRPQRDALAAMATRMASDESSPLLRALLADAWLYGTIGLDDTDHPTPPGNKPADADRPLTRMLNEQPLACARELVALLNDPGATRTVGYYHRFGGAFVLRTCGEQADRALRLLAGPTAPTNTPTPTTTEAHQDLNAACLRAWRAWLKRVEEQGLKELLQESITAGAEQAEQMLEQSLLEQSWLEQSLLVESFACRWPEQLDVLLPHANAHTLYAMLRHPELGSRDDVQQAAIRVLGQSASEGASISKLAQELLERGQKGVRTTLIESLAAFDLPNLPLEIAPRDDVRETLRVLAEHGGADGWNAIAAQIQHTGVAQRLAKILLTEPQLVRLPKADTPARPAFVTALLAALEPLLADLQPVADSCHVILDGNLHELAQATRADAAALTLRRLWPQEVAFVPGPEVGVRLDQIATARTVVANLR
ncbi:MAG: hypothetical protein AB8H80_00485 [Planctomycetota bacterium]